MNTLFLAWQNGRDGKLGEETRQWFPIGRLDREQGRYIFQYVYGAKLAEKEANFRPLASFPHLEKIYRGEKLFSLFQNRVPASSRPDYIKWLKRLGLEGQDVDPLVFLSVSGGTRKTDNLEAFAPIKMRNDGSFKCRFFVHGWRYVKGNQEQVDLLKPNDVLQVALEVNNPVMQDGNAIQLQLPDSYRVLGWAPRYLVSDVLKAVAHEPHQLKAHVVKVNHAPAPANQRFLVELSGVLPTSFRPMSSPEYESIAKPFE